MQVVPGTWTDFNNYVGICAECQASEKYRKLVRQRKVIVRPAHTT